MRGVPTVGLLIDGRTNRQWSLKRGLWPTGDGIHPVCWRRERERPTTCSLCRRGTACRTSPVAEL